MISARSMVDWRRGARHSKWKKMYDSFDYIRSVLQSYTSIHRPPINREAIDRKALSSTIIIVHKMQNSTRRHHPHQVLVLKQQRRKV